MKRVISAAGGLFALVVLSAGPVGAHVTVHPDEAEKGGFAILSFSVPNERDDASTVKLELQLPQNRVIPFVSVQPKPGWSVSVTKRSLDESDAGELTDVVDTIRWEGGEIGPGEFDLFLVSAGPLPTKGRQLMFKALQTYSSGEVVRWIETASKGEPNPSILRRC